MIHYKRGCFPGYFSRVLSLSGSVFPRAACVAFPNAIVAILLHLVLFSDYSPIHIHPEDMVVMNNSTLWTGFISLLGFLIVFRTSQAQSRFWEAVTHTQTIRSTWAQSASALCAFCRFSKANPKDTAVFKHTLLRLVSIMHALVLSELEDHADSEYAENIMAFNIEVFDPSGLDAESLKVLRDSDKRVELVYQWIQSLIVDNLSSGVLAIPPPILSRSFQELGNGMVAYQQALKISCVPFPFPYAQTCDTLLFLHWVLSPMLAVQWTDSIVFCGVFSFLQTLLLWSLNFIAVDMENPFGSDSNDLDFCDMQTRMNSMLTSFLREGIDRVPKLSSEALLKIQETYSEAEEVKMTENSTIFNSWSDLGDGVVARVGTTRSTHRRKSTLKPNSSTVINLQANAPKDRQREKCENSYCSEMAASAEGASPLSPVTDQGNSFQGPSRDGAPRREYNAQVIPREDPQFRVEPTLGATHSTSSHPAVAACRDAESRRGSPSAVAVATAENGGSSQRHSKAAV